MLTRRTLLAAGTASIMAAPFIARANANSQTPVVNGQRVRRRLSSLPANDPFFEAYSLAVERMRQEPESSKLSWISQARTHPDFCAHSRSNSTNLNFFSWHRPYLESFEMVCGELIGDPNFALPYWYWADNNGRLPPAFFDLAPLNTNNWMDDGNYVGIGWGPVSTANYRYLRPGFGLKDTPFGGSFTEQNINNVLGAGSFRVLTGLVEGDLHGTPHVVTGGRPDIGLGTEEGHMSNGLSPLEPMFWLHHCMVDHIWAMSGIAVSDQLAAIDDPDAQYSENFVDAQGNYRDIRIGDLFDMTQQSFTYDTLVPELQTAEQLASNASILATQDTIFELANARNISLPGTEKVISNDVSAREPTEFGIINRISVPFEGLPDQLTEKQLIPRRLTTEEVAFGIGDRRIYAEFDSVSVTSFASAGGLKVFVDCPYLSRNTPTTDPHFAGNMSFFGCSPDNCGSKRFLVDVTDPLQFRIAQGAAIDSVDLQVLAYDGSNSPLGEKVANIGAVRLISV